MMPELYQTGEAAEMVDIIKVMGVNPKTLKSLPNPKTIMFSLKLKDIKKGDIIQQLAYGQVSNKNKFACMFCYHTVLAQSSWDNVGFFELTEAKGTNITYEVHHEPWSDSFNYRFTEDLFEVFVNVLVYSASQAAVPGNQLVVDKDYGRQSIMLWRS